MSFWKMDSDIYEKPKQIFVKITLPKNIHKHLKVVCAKKGLSQRAYLTELVLLALNKERDK